MKKYELTDETKTLADGTVLHRIRAAMDFTLADGTPVRKGDLGGWIEREDNLDHDGSAWVSGKAKVYGKAKVSGEACVSGKAKVSGKAWVCGEAWVGDEAEVYGKAKVSGKAWVGGNAWVCGEAEVYGKAKVSGKAWVGGNAWVCGEACVSGNAWVSGNACVSGEACVSGNAWVSGEACVSGNAWVTSSEDYAVFKNSWSSFRWFTYTRSNRKWKVGCFCGTGEELIAKAYRDSELSGRCYEAIVRAQEAIDTAKEGGKE